MRERLRFLRKKLNLTQKSIAEAISLHMNSYKNIEEGFANPSKAVINRLCRFTGVNPEWLLEGKEPMFLEVPQKHKREKILEIIEKMSADELDALSRILDLH